MLSIADYTTVSVDTTVREAIRKVKRSSALSGNGTCFLKWPVLFFRKKTRHHPTRQIDFQEN
ncbi:MAG: hypothetical protein ACNA7H_12600 [Desulfotignum sp.]